MQISSIQTAFQDKENRTKAKYIGAATVLSAGSAFLATKPAKNAINNVKTSNRLLKAGLAGVVAAGVTTLLSMKKEELIAVKDKVAGYFNKNNSENTATNTQSEQNVTTMEQIQPELQSMEPEAKMAQELPQEAVQQEAPTLPEEQPQIQEAGTLAQNRTGETEENQKAETAQNPFASFNTTTCSSLSVFFLH